MGDAPAGLARVDPVAPGLTRRRRGRGWSFHDAAGALVSDPEEIARIRSLAIPPAWRDVWICPDPGGHIQAVGVDAAGRRQYRYHEEWRRRRGREKYDRVLTLGRVLPDVRAELARRLAAKGLGRDRVLAAGVRMLDVGVFRPGGEEYAPGDDDEDGTFGLATLRREHVRLARGAVEFAYPAKGGVARTLTLRDPLLHPVVRSLLRCAAPAGDDLLVYRAGRGWHDVRAEDLNAAVKEVAGEQYTCKPADLERHRPRRRHARRCRPRRGAGAGAGPQADGEPGGGHGGGAPGQHPGRRARVLRRPAGAGALRAGRDHGRRAGRPGRPGRRGGARSHRRRREGPSGEGRGPAHQLLTRGPSGPVVHPGFTSSWAGYAPVVTSTDTAAASRVRLSGVRSSGVTSRPDDGRDEGPLQRADRNMLELLQELRVAQTGVQILFAFLLSLSFTERFRTIDEFQLWTYIVTLLLSVVTAGLLVAPAAVHRVTFRRGVKPATVQLGHVLFTAGLGTLALTLTGAVLLVLDVAAGRWLAAPVAVGIGVVLVGLWFLLPLPLLREAATSNGPEGPPRMPAQVDGDR